jgi:ABC-2 type transport system permease protein
VPDADILLLAHSRVTLSIAMTLGFLAICMIVVWWIFKTGYRLKN